MGYAAATTFNGGFETFCVEYNEHFTPGSTFYYGISQGAINGGISGGNPDPISRGTAWLYLQLRSGHAGRIQLRSWTKWQRQRGSPAGDDLVAGR